jgi:FAD dependent oxidoreductase TIGR03364
MEAEAAPQGASVRNFGLIWVSGRRTGDELDAAQRSRQRWEEVARTVPDIGFRPAGSLTLASNDGERKVMEEFASHPDAAARSITFLDPAQVASLNPAVRGDIAGGLHCSVDAIVEPRHALGALRDHLSALGSYTYHPGRRAVAVEEHALVDTAGTRWEADLIVLATGANFDHLPGTERVGARVRRVRLQMLETQPYAGVLTTALADADTLRYYPAYEVVPQDLLGPQSPVAAAHHLQLLLVQRADGGLTIGDTHAYDEPFDFAVDETLYDALRHRAESILGWSLPPVVRRWAGTYAATTDDRTHWSCPIDSAVRVVTAPAGRGMTLSPAIAEQTWDEVVG